LENDLSQYKQLLNQHRVRVSEEYLKYEYAQEISIINFMILTKGKTDFEKLFQELNALSPHTISITLTNEVTN
ncbi:MAG: hypothetical protein HUK12_02745, partial [Muribaculaceae bacterium]|nr:hypothetical protein [Muribaculaceae bacterium]